ncbi:peptidoglycan-recognition protein LE isoform X2 [Anabrus simplex]|uniref:peptidoglycan-recognition protein LE isoform X2 n=1 Tax=Anabrus simplex TaxID=316456 RepID=UPI0035A2D0B1
MSVLAEDCDSSGEEFEDAREEWYGDGVSVSGEVQICSELGLSEDSRVRAASESDSDSEEFVDAEDSVDVLPDMVQGCRIDKNVEKALDALLSFRGGRAITKEEIANMYTSRMVHVGNVKYDLTRINLSEHQRLLMSQQVRTSYQDTQDDSDELRIVTRDEWKAEPPMDILTPLKTPVPLVIIFLNETWFHPREFWFATPPRSRTYLKSPVPCILIGDEKDIPCSTTTRCVEELRRLQRLSMRDRGFDDIPFNYLVGGDPEGGIFVGRGSHIVGQHSGGVNTQSIIITFLGNYNILTPSPIQTQHVEVLIAKMIDERKLKEDYILNLQSQVTGLESPGKNFAAVFKTWPRYTEKRCPQVEF